MAERFRVKHQKNFGLAKCNPTYKNVLTLKFLELSFYVFLYLLPKSSSHSTRS